MNGERFTLSWLSDPKIVGVNTLPPSSDHDFFATIQEAEEKHSSLVRSLDGVWQAHFAKNPAEAPDALLTDDAMDAALREIPVPCEFQLVNPEWDAPHYLNTQYPWDAHEALVPPQVSEKDNPTVTCVKRFHLSSQDLQHQIVLHFAGVEAAILVYLNGQEVGYAEDSFTSHAFDITAFAQQGENRLVVRVFKRCSGSWLEDQDFWRWNGIHRSVQLHFWPQTHLADLRVRTPLTDNYTVAHLETNMTLAGETDGQVQVQLSDRSGNILYQEMREMNGQPQIALATIVPDVLLWSAEEPNLYTLTVILTNAQQQVVEVAQTMVGFRQFEMRDRIMCLNGKRIVFHGVNRHEFDCDHGRAVPYETLLKDIQICKSLNINAIRTSHYPNCTAFYRLCDEYGLYVIDETNLETHGSWCPMHEWYLPGDREEWHDACIARGKAMLERDKNHPCVLIWSCGNESYGGKNLWELSEYFRTTDPTRLVHYEGVVNDPRYPDTSDMYSRMYCKAADIETYLKNDPKKPFINCEYTHAMGNSCGGMNAYTALEDKYPMYQGGFIWDYVDQGIRVKAPNGQDRFAYGGDFGDRPTAWNFIGNGIIMADRSLSPKAQEVRYLFRDVFLTPDQTGVTVSNQKCFATLRGYAIRWRVENDRRLLKEGEVELPEISAGESRKIELPYGDFPVDGQTVLTCQLVLKEQKGLLPAGTVLSHGQTIYGKVRETENAPGTPRLVWGDSGVGVYGSGLTAMFEYGKGLISFKNKAGREMLLCEPSLSLFRAPTDNDRGNGYHTREGVYHLLSRYNDHRYVEFKKNEKGEDTAICRYTTPLLKNLEITVVYTLRADDAMDVTVHWPGATELPDMPALGISFQLDPSLENVQYYGLGPEENYVDRRDGAYLGWHHYHVSEGMTPYLKPQESGNRGGVQALMLTDAERHGLQITGDALEISVQPWLPEELAAARHPSDLMGATKTVLDVAMFRKGVGGDDSWGAPTLPQYCYPAEKPYSFTFTMKAF